MTDTITYRADGSAETFRGREAVEVFRLATVISALSLEDKGIRVRRGFSALALAKTITGLKTNKRQEQIARLREMLEEQKDKVNHVSAEGATS